MNKAELIDVLVSKVGADRRTVTEMVEQTFDTIVRAVNNGEDVRISGFGVFEKRRRAPRVGRNVHTGQVVKVQAAEVPNFRAGTQFKAVVAGAVDAGQGLAFRRPGRAAGSEMLNPVATGHHLLV